MSNDLFSKFSKAVDAFTDVLTEDVDSKTTVALYKYETFLRFFDETQKRNPIVEKCTISVTQVNEFDGVAYPEQKFLIRIVFLDKNGYPIPINGNQEELLGRAIVANSIDTRMKNWMGDKKERTVVRKGGGR